MKTPKSGFQICLLKSDLGSLTHNRPAMPFANRKIIILEDLCSSLLSPFNKYHPSGNLKFDYLGIFKSLKLRFSMGKILSISLKLNFNPNT